MGRFFIIIGIISIIVGVLMQFKDRLPFLEYIGRLPGDIIIEGERSTFYFPIVTCIVISIVLSLILRIFR